MSKMALMDTLIQHIVLYGSVVWGPSLLEFDWASAEWVQVLRRIIKCKQSIPHNIILAEFGAHRFRLGAIFDLIWFLHWLWGYVA